MQRCKAITDELKKRPLNSYFLKPVDPEKEGLENYRKIVTTPMDFETIEKRLNSQYYNAPIDWYNDVCLVYENALKYHPKESIFHQIAEYNLNEFKKKAIGFACSEPHQWYEMVTQAMNKLSKEIARGPVPQGVDPLILSIVKRAENELPPPQPKVIAEVVEKINTMIEDDNVRYDVLCILKETEPNLKIAGEKMTIDADGLLPASVNTLSLYLKAHN